MICVVTGSCAGGGYELALAADHIILTDDGSSTVSLPELPLLAVLPGTGGLTRITDKRKVRRDHADVFCTTEEGVKGKRAVDWRLVDEVVPNTRLDEVVKERAREFAEKSDRPKRRQGHFVDAAQAQALGGRRRIQRRLGGVLARRAARHHHACAGPTRAPPKSADEMAAQGAEFWPLRLARELDDAILDIRLNEFDTAVIVFKSEGDPEAVLAYDKFLQANAKHWLAREIVLKWKRVLKRVDLTSRSLVTLDRAGLLLRRHARRTDLRRRPLLHADRPDGGRQPPAGDDHPRRRPIRSAACR